VSEIKRLNYFTSQFLVAQDFKDEQKYHIEMRRLHNRRMHTWGIVEGLRVFRPKGNDRSVVVLPGVAIDNKGREIVVAAETKVDLSDWGFDLNPPTRQRAFVYAAYKKEGCDPYPGNGLSYNTRWREEAHIGASVEDPAEDPADEPGSRIVLAEVGPAYELNTASRHYSGLNPEADISARRLTVRGETTAAGGLTVEADATVKSNLEVEGRAILRKTLTVDGDATLQTLAVERSINFGAVPRELLTLGEETCAIGIQEFTVYARTIRNFAWYVGGEHSNDLLVAGDKDGDGNRTGTR
jgi:hypothetical protein